MIFEEVGENNVGLCNYYLFLNMCYFNLCYVIFKDGVFVVEEEFGLFDGKLGEYCMIYIFYFCYLMEDVDYYINLEVKLKYDCVWVKVGYVVVMEQFLLRERKQKMEVLEFFVFLQVVEECQYICFCVLGIEILFDLKIGMMIGF